MAGQNGQTCAPVKRTSVSEFDTESRAEHDIFMKTGSPGPAVNKQGPRVPLFTTSGISNVVVYAVLLSPVVTFGGIVFIKACTEMYIILK